MYRSVAVVLLVAMFPIAQASIAPSGAAKQNAELDVKTNTFTDQRAHILAQMADGKTYSEISTEDRNKVKDALARIDGQLTASGSVDALSAQQKADVFNDQELVNTLLTQASADSRLVCTREKTVGSHRVTTQCMTVAARNRARDQSQDALRNIKVPTLEAR